MNIDRRAWMALAAGAVSVAGGTAANADELPVSSRVPGGERGYGPALAVLRAYASAELQTMGLPGMTMCVVDNDGFLALITLGWADVDRRIPVSTAHLFQIGSISKAFAALCLFSLADAGQVDLDAPVSRYLPDAPLPAETITVAQLLSHTGGLPDGAPYFPRTPDGKLWTGFAPGSGWSYSNTGYNLLGEVIASVTGRPHTEVIHQRVLEPLGMTGAFTAIRDADRERYAVGYVPFKGGRPALSGARMAPGPWTEERQAAGSIAATAEQMALYMRLLLRLGQGAGAPVIKDASARRFVTPVADADEFGPKARYGNGLATVLIDGVPCLHHTGGMILFSSSFHADPAAGVACFASVNAAHGDYRPRLTTAYAVQLLRAVRAKAPLPSPPNPLGKQVVTEPERYLGRYVSAAGEVLQVGKGPSGLTLVEGAAVGRLQRAGGELMTDLPSRSAHLLSFEGASGPAGAFWWGETLFGRDAAPAPMATPARLKAMAGYYLNRDPWVGGAWILARGDTLVLEGGGVLTERAGYWAVDKDVGGLERFRFDGLMNGKTQRLNMSGADLYRL